MQAQIEREFPIRAAEEVDFVVCPESASQQDGVVHVQ
jgi:hypothetical protein